MKNILLIISVSLLSLGAFAQSTTPRFGTPPSGDNTGRMLTYTYKAKDYQATDTIKPNASEYIYKVDTLTGAQTIKVNVTRAHLGDKLIILYVADSTRVVTFSTGFISYGTCSVLTNKYATVSFIFNGVKYVETARMIQP